VVDRDDYYRRIYSKTGSLFVLAAEAAGALAEVDSRTRERLRSYGKEIGIAFQIVDDMLDFVGSEAQVGKPLGGDLAQGLLTLPTILFLEGSPDDKQVLDVLQGNRTARGIQLALEAVRNSEAIPRAHQVAIKHANLAKAAMSDLPDNRYRQTLLELADYTVLRDL
jgi:geranylgeranyl pyrophosphate synthase